MINEQDKIRESYRKAVAEAYDADPVMTVSEWANKYRILPQKGAAEPGPYRTDRTPYMREVMDCLSVTSPVQELVLMAGAQVGKSEAGNNWTGYVIDVAPGPMLLVQPTVENAKRYSKQRIGPMIAESPRLAAKVLDNKSRDSGNTQLEKEFPGGILLLGGANSAAGLRSMPIRYAFFDEISNWPADVDGEGDPLELAQARTSTFSRRKIYKCSTPGKVIGVEQDQDGNSKAAQAKTQQVSCRITAEYRRTDMRRYFVPCQHCGHMHTLDWENFVIPTDPDTGKKKPRQAYMVCPDCGGVHHEHHKTAMLAGGEWRATNPEAIDPLKRGYQIGSLYSPVGWKSWAKIAKEWLDAQGNPTKLQAFWNNVLGLPWEVKGERLDDAELMKRVEDYTTSPLPAGVVVLTAGIDVQMDRIEMEVVGWGRGEESWSIAYIVLYGDTQQAGVWAELDAALRLTYQHPAGFPLQVGKACIDTGGGEGVTQAVYEYVFSRFAAGMPVLGIKGFAGEGRPIIGPPSTNNTRKIPLFPVGTLAAKDMVYGRLRIEEPGPGYCHFGPHNTRQYFQMLTAEEVRTKLNTKGFPVREWFKIRERNEALDCRVYATAALHTMQLNLDQLADMIAGAWQAPVVERRVRGELAAAE